MSKRAPQDRPAGQQRRPYAGTRQRNRAPGGRSQFVQGERLGPASADARFRGRSEQRASAAARELLGVDQVGSRRSGSFAAMAPSCSIAPSRSSADRLAHIGRLAIGDRARAPPWLWSRWLPTRGGFCCAAPLGASRAQVTTGRPRHAVLCRRASGGQVVAVCSCPLGGRVSAGAGGARRARRWWATPACPARRGWRVWPARRGGVPAEPGEQEGPDALEGGVDGGV